MITKRSDNESPSLELEASDDEALAELAHCFLHDRQRKVIRTSY